MKLLPKYSKKNIYSKILITDVNGDSTKFDSVKKAAKFLEVNISRVYAAFNRQTTVRGCSIKSYD